MAGTGVPRPLRLAAGAGPRRRGDDGLSFGERAAGGPGTSAGGGGRQERGKGESPPGRMPPESGGAEAPVQDAPGKGMKKAPTVARRRLTLPAWKGQTGN